MSDGNDSDFELLLPYYRRVVKFFRDAGFSAQDSLDLTQEVYIRVYRARETYRGEAKWNYLKTVARHIATNAIRDIHAAKREGIHVPEDELVHLADPSARAADTAMEIDATQARVRGAIAQLPERLIPCVLLSLDGYSYDEIAGMLGITISALKSRLHEARKLLRDLLDDEPQGLGGDQ